MGLWRTAITRDELVGVLERAALRARFRKDCIFCSVIHRYYQTLKNPLWTLQVLLDACETYRVRMELRGESPLRPSRPHMNRRVCCWGVDLI